MKWLVILFFCIGLPLAGAEDVIRISNFGKESPSTDKAIAKLNKAYTALGIRMELIMFPAERALYESNSGHTDGELLRPANLSQKYPNLIQLKTPLVEVNMVAFSLDDQIKLQNGWADLRGHRFTYERGTKSIEAHTAGFKGGIPSNSLDIAFFNLQQGRVEMVLADKEVGLEFLKKIDPQGKIKVLSPPLLSMSLHHYLNKKHSVLADRLNQQLMK